MQATISSIATDFTEAKQLGEALHTRRAAARRERYLVEQVPYSSASARSAVFPQIEMLGVWYKFVNSGA